MEVDMEAAEASPVVAALTVAQRARLLDRGVARRLDPGDILHLSGDSRPRLHLVTKGVVKLSARDGEGRETIVGLAIRGDLVGELAALDDLCQPADAIAATRVEAFTLDADSMRAVLEENPRVALALARGMAKQMRWLYATTLERTSSEVTGRLAGRLLDLGDLLGRIERGALEIDLPVAQGDLGRLAGVSRESTCKALRSFQSQGLLDYSGRRLRILRPDLLERIRCAGRTQRTTNGAAPPADR
jgi:CRP/FNR family transcriptional regulator, cyclic AMP receptor protein